MAALALCGTAVAETKTYEASDYQGKAFDAGVFGEGANVVLNVNDPVTLGSISAYLASSLTLNFVGGNILSSGGLDLEVGKGSGSLAITGDPNAKNHWATALTSADITSVTLASGTGGFYTPKASVSFDEWDEPTQGITLGNATVDYMGYHEVTSEDAAKALITGNNQIALVTITGTKQLALVGKISGSPVPEPATATLSLLALAGLASRRRRH